MIQTLELLSAVACSHKLGAVLLHEQANGDLKTVSYISSSTEDRYAWIEKEALALTWACEHFSNFLVGLKFSIEAEHINC